MTFDNTVNNRHSKNGISKLQAECLVTWHTVLIFSFFSPDIPYQVIRLLTVSQLGLTCTIWERSLMVRSVVGSILHGMDPLSYFSFQPCSMTGVTKAVVCAILSVGWGI